MISIIIPTINEQENILRLIPYLKNCCGRNPFEIIIADGGSTDETTKNAASLGARFISSTQKGRSIQMNAGAKAAKYDILYFVHADTIPPSSFYTDITEAVKAGYEMGRYRTKFAGNRNILKLNAFFTRFDWFICYGGDQTLYVTKPVFEKANGYTERLLIMEEFDFVKRARASCRYKIFPKAALVSIRKYETNSWWQVQRANYITVQNFKKGMPQKELIENYRRLLKGIR